MTNCHFSNNCFKCGFFENQEPKVSEELHSKEGLGARFFDYEDGGMLLALHQIYTIFGLRMATPVYAHRDASRLKKYVLWHGLVLMGQRSWCHRNLGQHAHPDKRKLSPDPDKENVLICQCGV